MKTKLTKSIISAVIIITFAIYGGIWQPPSSANTPSDLPHLDLSDFLAEINMDLNEYIATMDELSEIWPHPYYLDENESRYEDFQKIHPDIPYESIIAFVNVRLDLGHYTDVFEALDIDEITVLVNKTFHTPSTWAPDDLTNIGTGHMMRENAVEPMNSMREAMADAGLKVHIISTYRSYAQQANTFNNALAVHSVSFTEMNFARPGHSEHQTGLVVDMLQQPYETTMQGAKFHESENFKWLTENAHKYGFILRYPEAYQDIHGYIFEPWHWRFVGVDVAMAMFDMEISLYEDFYGRYLESNVLHRAREIILFEYPALLAEEEAARNAEIAEAERNAEEEAARLAAEEEAARLAAEEEEAARLAAIAEAERLAAEQAAQDEADASVREPLFWLLYLIPVLLIAALVITAVGANKSFKRNKFV